MLKLSFFNLKVSDIKYWFLRIMLVAVIVTLRHIFKLDCRCLCKFRELAHLGLIYSRYNGVLCFVITHKTIG